MFTLDLLRVALARAVDFRGEVPLEGTPIVCIVVSDAKGLEQRLQLYKDFVRAPAKDVRQNLPGTVIDSIPQLALLLLLAHKTPHFVHFGFVHALEDDLDVARGQAFDQGMIHRGERSPFFSTRE
jgi:hypothetical protein